MDLALLTERVRAIRTANSACWTLFGYGRNEDTGLRVEVSELGYALENGSDEPLILVLNPLEALNPDLCGMTRIRYRLHKKRAS